MKGRLSEKASSLQKSIQSPIRISPSGMMMMSHKTLVGCMRIPKKPNNGTTAGRKIEKTHHQRPARSMDLWMIEKY